jgi:hypothetical protein
MVTRQPFSASCLATAAPIPDDDPVTMAEAFFSSMRSPLVQSGDDPGSFLTYVSGVLKPVNIDLKERYTRSL